MMRRMEGGRGRESPLEIVSSTKVVSESSTRRKSNLFQPSLKYLDCLFGLGRGLRVRDKVKVRVPTGVCRDGDRPRASGMVEGHSVNSHEVGRRGIITAQHYRATLTARCL